MADKLKCMVNPTKTLLKPGATSGSPNPTMIHHIIHTDTIYCTLLCHSKSIKECTTLGKFYTEIIWL